MKDKFKISLVWHNCKTYSPEEDWNDQLIVTDGEYTTVVRYDNPYGWYDMITDERIPESDLSEYWWADVRQTMAASIELMDARNKMKENTNVENN